MMQNTLTTVKQNEPACSREMPWPCVAIKAIWMELPQESQGIHLIEP